LDRDCRSRHIPLIQASVSAEEIARTMEQIGLPAEVVYAFRKTGRIVCDTNLHLISAQDRAEWTAAVDEFRGARDPSLSKR
jgi:hypothetical protein